MSSSESKKIIQCACGAKLAVSTSAARVQCPKCKRTLPVNPTPTEPAIPAPQSVPPSPSTAAAGWHLALGKSKVGPLSADDVADMLANGRLHPTDMVLPPGGSRWTTVASVSGLLPEIRRPTPKNKTGKWLLFGAIAGIGLVVIGVLLFILLRDNGSDPIAKANTTPEKSSETDKKKVDEKNVENKKPSIVPGEGPEPKKPDETPKKTGPEIDKTKTPAPAVKPGDPLDTSFIARDFHAAFVLSPRRLLESKLAKALPPDLLREPEAALGIELRNLEQVVVVLDHIKPEPMLVKKEGPKDD